MTADLFNSKLYAISTADASLSQETAYAVSTQTGSLMAVKGTLSQHLSGSMVRAQDYAVLANPSSLTSINSYVVHRNDASINPVGYILTQPKYPPYAGLSVEFPFLEMQFPSWLSYGSQGGPGFKTSVFRTDSGAETASAVWERLRARYTVQFDSVPKKDSDAVVNFFHGMRGQGIGFRFKDWSDYQIARQTVVVGDGQSRIFQLFKRYRSGAQYFDRIIRKPVRGSINTITLDGVELTEKREFFVNYVNGQISFVDPPPEGSIGTLAYAEFDVPVRFATDELSVSADDFDQYSIDSLDLIEILT